MKDSFIFHRSFFQTYKSLKQIDSEVADEYLEAVVNYGLNKVISLRTDTIAYATMLQTKEIIDNEEKR